MGSDLYMDRANIAFHEMQVLKEQIKQSIEVALNPTWFTEDSSRLVYLVTQLGLLVGRDFYADDSPDPKESSISGILESTENYIDPEGEHVTRWVEELENAGWSFNGDKSI